MLTDEILEYISAVDNMCAKADVSRRRLKTLDDEHASFVEKQKFFEQSQRKRIKEEFDETLGKVASELSEENERFSNRMGVIAKDAEKIPAELRAGAVIDEPTVQRCDFDQKRLWPILEKLMDDSLRSKIKATVRREDQARVRQELANEYLTQIEAWKEKTRREHDAVEAGIVERKLEAQAKAKKAEKDLMEGIKRDNGQEREKYNSQRAACESELEAALDLTKIQPFVDEANRDFDSMFSDFEMLDRAKVPDKAAPGIILGSVFHKIPQEEFSKRMAPIMGGMLRQNWMAMPFHLKTTGSYFVLVETKDDKQRDMALRGVRALISRSLASYPIEGIEVSYIDPVDRGTNLKYLQSLAASPDCPAIRPVAASEEAIDAEVAHLVHAVDELSLQLAMIGDIDDYNSRHHAVIPHRLVVVADFPSGFSRKALESFRVLMSNRAKCGISFFVIKDAAEELERDAVELYDEFGKAADVFIKNDYIRLPEGKKRFSFGATGYPKNLISRVKETYATGRAVDNAFSRMCTFEGTPAFGDSTNGLFIPFAIDRQNELVTLELGTSSAAHMVLTGSTGSGKSTTLHAIIAGLMLSYHPQDVELWLVDYKETEFAEYIANRFPAIKLIGLDKSKEFTYALVDLITDEMLRRASLFAEDHVQDIKAYKKKHGLCSLPRIVIMIDEFHNLTQTIKDDPEYVVKFENILSECRSTGMSCVLSDQSILDGLRGLTDKGKKQLTSRIAMRNSADEVRATLDLDSSFYTDELKAKMRVLNTGDIVMKREVRSAEGAEATIEVDKYKSVYVSAEDRVKLAPYMQANAVVPPFTPLIVNGQNRSPWSKSEIDAYEATAPKCRTGETFLYLGKPSNFDPCFRILLTKQLGQNVAVLGQDLDRRMSVVLRSIGSFLRQPQTRAVLLAHPEDPLYERYRGLFKIFKQRVEVKTDIPGICDEIASLASAVEAGERKHVLAVVLGYEFLCDEFDMLPKKSDGKGKKKESGSAILDMMADLGLGGDEDAGGDADYSEGYDARDDLAFIASRGCRYGVHMVLSLEKTKEMRKNRQLKLDSFDHRISTPISPDESLEFFGSSQAAKGIDDISAAYSDSGSAPQAFRPYLLPRPKKRKRPATG